MNNIMNKEKLEVLWFIICAFAFFMLFSTKASSNEPVHETQKQISTVSINAEDTYKYYPLETVIYVGGKSPVIVYQ